MNNLIEPSEPDARPFVDSQGNGHRWVWTVPDMRRYAPYVNPEDPADCLVPCDTCDGMGWIEDEDGKHGCPDCHGTTVRVWCPDHGVYGESCHINGEIAYYCPQCDAGEPPAE